MASQRNTTRDRLIKRFAEAKKNWDADVFFDMFKNDPREIIRMLRSDTESAKELLSGKWRVMPKGILHYCALNNGLDWFAALLQLGADPFVVTKKGTKSMIDGCSVFHAVCHPSLKLLDPLPYLKALESHCASQGIAGSFTGALNTVALNPWGGTVLLYAARYLRDDTTIQWLIEKGADAHKRDEYGYCALLWVLDWLKDTPTPGERNSAIKAYTSLMECMETAEVSLGRVFKIDEIKNNEGGTLLFWALNSLQLESKPVLWANLQPIVQDLVSRGSKLDGDAVAGVDLDDTSPGAMVDKWIKDRSFGLREVGLLLRGRSAGAPAACTASSTLCASSSSGSSFSFPPPLSYCGGMKRGGGAAVASNDGVAMDAFVDREMFGRKRRLLVHDHPVPPQASQADYKAELRSFDQEEETSRVPCTCGLAKCYCRSGRTKPIERVTSNGEVLETYCAGSNSAKKLSAMLERREHNVNQTDFVSITAHDVPAHLNSVVRSSSTDKVERYDFLLRYKDDQPCNRSGLKRVVQISSTGQFVKTFSSASAAAKHCGISIGSVDQICGGKLKSSKGMYFRWQEPLFEKCETCHEAAAVDNFLVCEGCSAGFHFRCANIHDGAPLDTSGVPLGDFFCSPCAAERPAVAAPPEGTLERVGMVCLNSDDKAHGVHGQKTEPSAWLARSVYWREDLGYPVWRYAFRQVNAGPNGQDAGVADSEMWVDEVVRGVGAYSWREPTAHEKGLCAVHVTFGSISRQGPAAQQPTAVEVAAATEASGSICVGDGDGADNDNNVDSDDDGGEGRVYQHEYNLSGVSVAPAAHLLSISPPPPPSVPWACATCGGASDGVCAGCDNVTGLSAAGGRLFCANCFVVRHGCTWVGNNGHVLSPHGKDVPRTTTTTTTTRRQLSPAQPNQGASTSALHELSFPTVASVPDESGNRLATLRALLVDLRAIPQPGLCLAALHGRVAHMVAEVFAAPGNEDNTYLPAHIPSVPPPGAGMSGNLCFRRNEAQVIDDPDLLRIRSVVLEKGERALAAVKAARVVGPGAERHKPRKVAELASPITLTMPGMMHFAMEKIIQPLVEDPRLFSRPGLFEGIELAIRQVPDTDPRVGLRGQQAAFAVLPIAANTLIGPYAGRLCFSDRQRHGSVLSMLAHEAYQCTVQTEFDLPTGGGDDVKRGGGGGEGGVGEDDARLVAGGLVIDVFADDGPPHGNATMYINDPHGPSRAPGAGANRGGGGAAAQLKANCAFVEVCYHGWPFVFVACVKDVAAGDELLVDYGRDYWRHQDQMMEGLKRVKLAR